MEYVLGTIEQFRRLDLSQIPDFDCHTRITATVGQIVQAARCKIIDDANMEFPLPKQVDHVAANETCSACYYGDWRCALHRNPTLRTVLTLKYCSLSRLFGNFPDLKAVQRSRTASSIVRLGT